MIKTAKRITIFILGVVVTITLSVVFDYSLRLGFWAAPPKAIPTMRATFNVIRSFEDNTPRSFRTTVVTPVFRVNSSRPMGSSIVGFVCHLEEKKFELRFSVLPSWEGMIFYNPRMYGGLAKLLVTQGKTDNFESGLSLIQTKEFLRYIRFKTEYIDLKSVSTFHKIDDAAQLDFTVNLNAKTLFGEDFIYQAFLKLNDPAGESTLKDMLTKTLEACR